METKTIDIPYGQYHVVRATGAVTMTQTTKDGTVWTVFACGENGTAGREEGFTALASKVTISCETGVKYALVPTFSRGCHGGAAAEDEESPSYTLDETPTANSGNLLTSGAVYAALAGKQDALTLDSVPRAGGGNPVTSGAVYQHTSDSGKHVTPGDKQRLNNAVLSLTSMRMLPSGTSNFYARYIVLDTRHVVRGHLQSVSMRCRVSGTAQATPFYLGVFEQPEGGGSDPATWTFLGASEAAVQEAIGESRGWSFDNIELAGGRAIALCPMTTPTQGWNTAMQIGLRVSERPDSDTVSNVNGSAFLPQMTLSVMVQAAELLASLEERVSALENT